MIITERALRESVVKTIEAVIGTRVSESLNRAVHDFCNAWVDQAESNLYEADEVDFDLAARITLKEWHERAQQILCSEMQQMSWIETFMRKREVSEALAWLEELEQIVENLWTANESLLSVSQKLWNTPKH